MMVLARVRTFPGGRINFKDKEEWMRVIKATRTEMDIIPAKPRIKEALKANLPSATRFDLKIGQRATLCMAQSGDGKGHLLIRSFQTNQGE